MERTYKRYVFIRHAHFASLDCHAYARNDKMVGHPHPIELHLPLVIPSNAEESRRKPHFATLDSSLRYSQQLCLCIESLRFSPLKKAVATLISAFANPCKQVASLDIDRMTIWAGHPHPIRMNGDMGATR